MKFFQFGFRHYFLLTFILGIIFSLLPVYVQIGKCCYDIYQDNYGPKPKIIIRAE